MSNKNSHIISFLDYYQKLTVEPKYAVLLRGEWGCGKTFLIKNWLKERSEIKSLYVSLYGVTSYAQIEDSFFEQLHPLLASNGMKVTGKILRSAVKVGLRCDLFEGDSSEIKASLSVPSLSIFSNFPAKEGIIIFDDLERCNIEIKDILGYINYFVEHAGAKVIILGDENKIKESARYAEIKEKLIGKTFEVIPDIEEAINSFVQSFDSLDLKKLFNENIKELYDLHIKSRSSNLRIFRQVMMDFERLYQLFDNEVRAKNEAVIEILKYYFIYSIAMRMGLLVVTDMNRISSREFELMMRRDNTISEPDVDNEKLDEFLNIYENFNVANSIFSMDVWANIIFRNIIDANIINEAIKKSHYFYNENAPTWMNLWHFMDLSENDFRQLIEKFHEDNSSKIPSNCGELLHIAGIMIHFSKLELIDIKNEDINEILEELLRKMNDEGILASDEIDITGYAGSMGYAGLGYSGIKEVSFQNFRKLVIKKRKESKERSLPNKAKGLLLTMKENAQLFYRMITVSNSEDQIYYNIPILRHIAINDFFDAITAMPSDSKNIIIYALKERYKYINKDIGIRLITEKDWLKEVIDLINKNASESTKLIQLQLNAIAEGLGEALKLLEQAEGQINNKTPSEEEQET